jgi:hypothetical protein
MLKVVCPRLSCVKSQNMNQLRRDPYPPEFAALREAPLHMLWGAAWSAYYLAMEPWMHHERVDVRASAVERLTMATFWAEFGGHPRGASEVARARARLAWLIGEVGRSHLVHDDTIPAFLRGLRYHGYTEPYRTPVLAWLDTLVCEQSINVDAGLIEGTRLLIAGVGDDLPTSMTHWLRRLDHSSDYVRACAAYQLGNFSDEETSPCRIELFSLIGTRERNRPGIAGPFWTPQYSGSIDLDLEQKEQATAWMLDLLEQRQGKIPADMPFNDIVFYLHELCSLSPLHMWRMLRGGHIALALMTATEINDPVEGVEPILTVLSADADPDIAARARNHLTAHYSKP